MIEQNMLQRYRQVLIAFFSSVVLYLAANAAESALIEVLHPTEVELTWISDLILAGGFGCSIYFWLHLKAARQRLADAERARIAADTELALASEIQRHFLPAAPDPLEGVRWAASQVPAGRIGGDFYDFVRTGDHSMLVLLGDISGKGVPAMPRSFSSLQIDNITLPSSGNPLLWRGGALRRGGLVRCPTTPLKSPLVRGGHYFH